MLIATGVYKPRDIGGPGAGLDGIVPALDFLTASNRQGLGDNVPEFDSGALNAAGKRVVVIGGGDTAMDCVRTAVRQGAASVKCLYRRDQANMPGSMREVKNAQEEGVEFVWLSAPGGVPGRRQRDRRARAAHAARHAGRVRPAVGRAVRRALHGGGRPGDQGARLRSGGAAELWGVEGLKVSRWGTLQVDHRTAMTALPGVFAAGDIVRGASLVVWAIKDGRDAAARMHEYMQQSALAVAAE